MSVFENPNFDHHEAVHCFEDQPTGLRAIIAIHSTALGPAAGGCRRWQYGHDDDAVTDVLRLSRGMTYKNALAGVPFGGGKAVILASDEAPKSRELFLAFGRAVDSLGGRYITAEDVGIGVEDMQSVRDATRYVTGVSGNSDLVGGDPSPWTGLGVYHGILAAVKARLGADSVRGLRVAVQGVGHVGYQVCRLLHEAGAELIVADINARNVQRAVENFGARSVGIGEILSADCDVLAPCALGNILNEQSIPMLKAKVVAGAANNQLALDEDGNRLKDLGILYAPDYVINAGGIISVSKEYLGGETREAVRQEIAQIAPRLGSIFEVSEKTSTATNIVADRLARRIVSEARNGEQRQIA